MTPVVTRYLSELENGGHSNAPPWLGVTMITLLILCEVGGWILAKWTDRDDR